MPKADKKDQPIIRKYLSEEEHGHHGGNWKVAYADLMTAMMAFFLLMWLLSSQDEIELKALADYFTPSDARQEQQGGQGVLWGQTPGVEGIMGEVSEVTEGAAQPVPAVDPAPPQVTAEHIEPAPRPAEKPADIPEDVTEARETEDPDLLAELAARKLAEAARQAELDRVAGEIRNTILTEEDRPDLLDNIEITLTSEGLLIQIIERDRKPVFASGSAELGENARALVAAISGAVVRLPYPVVISGHTDAVPFRGRQGYSNWELSTDRAHGTRRLMAASGVAEERFSRVSGLAATELRNPEAPDAAENRRIDILLRYGDPLAQTLGPSLPEDGPQ